MTDAELRERLFQAPDEWFDAHTMGGEIECVHLTNEGIEAIMQLMKARDTAKELEGAENAARIIRNSPEPSVDLTKYIRKLEGEIDNEE